MKISQEEFGRLMDGIAYAVTTLTFAMTDEQPSVEYVELATRKIACDYLDLLGVDEVDETIEDEDMDAPYDEVDETNYDPYMGCDFYETSDIDEGW